MQVNKLRQETTEKHCALASDISYLSGDDHLKTIAEVNMFSRMVLVFKLRSINRNTNSERMFFN